MRNKRTQIGISYWASPNKPNSKCHKDANPENLVQFRTRKFAIEDYKKAWAFLEACDKPVTKLSQILWAFPKEESFVILELEAKEQEVMEFEEIKAAQDIAAEESVEIGQTLDEELEDIGIK